MPLAFQRDDPRHRSDCHIYEGLATYPFHVVASKAAFLSDAESGIKCLPPA